MEIVGGIMQGTICFETVSKELNTAQNVVGNIVYEEQNRT